MMSTKRAMPLGMLLSLYHVPFRSIHSFAFTRPHLKTLNCQKIKDIGFLGAARAPALLLVSSASVRQEEVSNASQTQSSHQPKTPNRESTCIVATMTVSTEQANTFSDFISSAPEQRDGAPFVLTPPSADILKDAKVRRYRMSFCTNY